MTGKPQSHTPTPWKLDTETCITDKSGKSIAWTDCARAPESGPTEKSDREDEANAARIVACVNACAGIPDPLATLASVRAALERLSNAAEAFAASQDSATDDRCGLVQPISVAEGMELLHALDQAHIALASLTQDTDPSKL